jgi:hypothetical protein
MSAYVVVEFTVKDPDVYREKYGPNAGRTAKEARFSPTVTGRSCTAMARSLQAHSCGFPTMRRPSTGTTRLNISS